MTSGIHLLNAHHAYVASLPPDHVACGMPALAALAMIVIGGPVCGVVGSVISIVTTLLVSAIAHSIRYRFPDGDAE